MVACMPAVPDETKTKRNKHNEYSEVKLKKILLQ